MCSSGVFLTIGLVKMELGNILQEFISQPQGTEQITMYNKAGLQHELVNFLQQQLELAVDYGVQLEREVKAVVMGANYLNRSINAIDVYVYQRAGKEQYGVQVIVLEEQNEDSLTSELENQLQFLQTLK